MSVPFRFDTVLRIREVERDLKRQALAQGQSQEAKCRRERDRIAAEREQTLNDLRTLQTTDGWKAAQAVARQRHAEQLGIELAAAEASLTEAVEQLTRHRQELVEADTAVKALEKLAGRHHADQSRLEQSQEQQSCDEYRRPGWAA